MSKHTESKQDMWTRIQGKPNWIRIERGSLLTRLDTICNPHKRELLKSKLDYINMMELLDE